MLRGSVASCLLFLVAVSYHDTAAQTAEKQYAELQEKIASGWNTWSYGSMLTYVLLPEGLSLKINFRNSFIGTPYDPDYFLEDITVDKSGRVRPVAHTFDGSYTEIIIDNWYGNSIRVQSAVQEGEIFILVTPVKNSASVHYNIELQTGMMWNRAGDVMRQGDSITARINGKTHIIRSATKPVVSFHSYTSPNIAVAADGPAAFYTGEKKTTEQIAAIVEGARLSYEKYAGKFAELSEAFKGIESVLGWNTLYDPEHNRVITPVTRGWNEAWQGYVLFEWDTYFAALLFSLDNKDLAYSNAIAVTKGQTKQGAVGFTQMPGGRVSEQSQPPVGSMVCWMIYEKFHEKWFLEEVYNELLSWNRWWPANRVNRRYLTWGAPWKNAEKKHLILESGLDNSPMYEDISVEEVGINSLMNLADAGLMGLYTADCLYLSKIATALGKTADQHELEGRADHFAELTGNLWNEKDGIYENRFLDRPEFSTRLSPTLFYPMIAKIPSASKASRILKSHFFNPNEFYGPYMMPSCARNDKSYNNDYWRGAVWGPMNLLVYLGLRNYDKKAASELADKSFAIYSEAWGNNHYVFENTNSETGANMSLSNQLNSDPYYTWGALLAIMKFMEKEN